MNHRKTFTEVTYTNRYAQRADDRFVGDVVLCSLLWDKRAEQSM